MGTSDQMSADVGDACGACYVEFVKMGVNDENMNERVCSNEEWSLEQHMELLRNSNSEEDIFQGNSLEMPEWFDLEKFRRGQQYFNENFYALFVSKLCGLLAILTVPEINSILVMTKQSSEPKTAFKRYLSTIAHMLLWYGGDVHDKSSWAFQSLREVHMKHTAASNRGKKEKKGVVSQSSLALTQFGFMGYGLLMPQKLGIKNVNEDDVAGFIHFWRTIGYLVGIQDKYNICRESVSETKAICTAILQDMFVPVMKEPPEEFTHLATALLKGMWGIVPQIDVEGFSMYLKYISGMSVERCSNWYSRFMFWFQQFVHETLLGSEWFGGLWRRFLNNHMWFTVVVTCKFPLLAYYAFGIPLKPMAVLKS